MPIEIRELVIRATVNPGDSGEPASRGVDASRPAGTRSESSSEAHAPDDLVQTCIREVLRILEEKRER